MLRCVLRSVAIAAIALLTSSQGFAADPADGSRSPSLEQRLADIIDAIRSNQIEHALSQTDAVIAQYPNFRLAHLIRGDLLSARARPLPRFGNVNKRVPAHRVEELRAEALARLQALGAKPTNGAVPRDIVQMHAGQRYAFIVDSRRSRLYVFENAAGRARLVTDYYVTLGKRGVEKTREGDQKTPIGVYHVTANLPRSKLSDFYGAGAFPINYPNAWDRRLGRNGYGIWLHGTPSETYSRPPRASDGCIVLANPDLSSIGKHVQIGDTPVIITDEVEWTDLTTLERERRSIDAALQSWRSDWESRRTERYLSHYSARFSSGSHDIGTWSAHKRSVNAAKGWIKVGISRVSVFRYPRERDFLVVTFDQDYRSSNLSNRMRKIQYWALETGRWRILHEGSI